MAKIILITHQKGGVGKSTITYNLAVNLKDNAKVCILDMDIQGSLMNINELSEVSIFPAEKLKELQKSDYDFIFIDTPPYLNDRIEELCSIADVILIPTKAGVLDLLAIKSTIDLVQRAKAEKRALIIFNMVKPNTTLTAEIKDQLEEYKIKVSKNMLSDLVAFSRSVLVNGVEESRNAQKQIDNLTKEILTLSIQ